MSLIKIEHLRKEYPDVTPLKDVSVDINKGDVLSIIRSLAEQGMTMMIVTHEMKFARDVSTRVFYMDEGGIYEEGTPEEIFDHPKKEKTRIFIRRLKTLSLKVLSPDLDYADVIDKIRKFCRDTMQEASVSRNMTRLQKGTTCLLRS